jgi:uncharacterized protein YqgV (UPF0045/DUF77 family)
MASKEDFLAEMAKLADKVESEKAQVSAAMSAAVKAATDPLNAKIAELQAQVASGGNVTAADLDEMVAAVKNVENAVDSIVPAGDSPVPQIPTL